VKKIVSFDLDGTLVDGRYGDLVWNKGIPEEYARKHSIAFDEAYRYIRSLYESVGDEDILWYEMDHWLRRFGLPVTTAEIMSRYETHIRLVPGAAEVLDALKEKYTLIVASNAARVFVDKELEYTGLTCRFTHIISATTDYKMVKKQQSFFETLCRELSVAPEEVIHVGDHPIFDYETPARLGIESYYFRSKHSPLKIQETFEGDGRVIGNLMELLPGLLG
jgi:HAD superfamily hydrolase (TIGR01493 family)